MSEVGLVFSSANDVLPQVLRNLHEKGERFALPLPLENILWKFRISTKRLEITLPQNFFRPQRTSVFNHQSFCAGQCCTRTTFSHFSTLYRVVQGTKVFSLKIRGTSKQL